jgi:hypothetical protein
MEDFTFYFSYLDELEKFDYDTEKFTFNGFSVDTFSNYRTHLTQLQKEFEKKLDAIIISDTYPTDKLIRNFGVLNIKFDKKYEQVRREYGKFVNQHKYWQLPKTKEHESRKIPSGRFMKSPELKMLDAIIGFHVSILNLTKDCITSRLAFVATAATGKIKVVQPETPTVKPENKNIAETQSDTLLYNNPNKLLLNLSKKEIAMLFIFLFHNDIAKPDDKGTLYSFIENSFKFVDDSKGKQEVKDITKMNTVFARLTSGQNESESKKFRDKMITKYQDKVYDFFEDFKKYKLEKFRDDL